MRYVDCVGRNNIHGRRCSVRVDNSWKYKSPGREKQPLCTLPHAVRPSLSLVLSVAKADRINNDNIKYRWRENPHTHERARAHIRICMYGIYMYHPSKTIRVKSMVIVMKKTFEITWQNAPSVESKRTVRTIYRIKGINRTTAEQCQSRVIYFRPIEHLRSMAYTKRLHIGL